MFRSPRPRRYFRGRLLRPNIENCICSKYIFRISFSTSRDGAPRAFCRAQIAGGQETHAEDVDQGILVGLVHVAEEVRAPHFVDNAGGRRRKVAQVFRVGQHGGNIETGQQQREHGIAGTARARPELYCILIASGRADRT